MSTGVVHSVRADTMAGAANLRLKGARVHFRRKIRYNLRERFGRSEVVRSLQTRERRTAAARALMVWLQVERVFETVLQEPTLRREQIDRLLENAAADIAWADEIRLARNGSIFDHHGSPPLDADALVLESEAQTWRKELARNDVSSIQGMAHRCADRMGLNIRPGSVDERLIGRALLKLLAENAEQTAETLRREVYPFLHSRELDHDDLDPEISEATSPPDLSRGDVFPYCIANEASDADAMVEIKAKFASKEPAAAEHE
ncbi:hypothetical protein LCGC14_0637210, partial [marine sediment metagenome]